MDEVKVPRVHKKPFGRLEEKWLKVIVRRL
jgi:hypothetical protein